eukprot:5376368-Prymnesium_polylepis.1
MQWLAARTTRSLAAGADRRPPAAADDRHLVQSARHPGARRQLLRCRLIDRLGREDGAAAAAAAARDAAAADLPVRPN